MDRGAFWRYCTQTEGAARARAKAKGVPCSITAHEIDALFVDQKWKCAISGVGFDVPAQRAHYRKAPFGPSLDRIDPRRGYIPGNVRLVCNMVNQGIGEWGADNFLILVETIAGKASL